jgi:seryl-tRNA synthetase
LFASVSRGGGGGDEAKIDEVLRVDVERRQTETALQQLNADRND